MLVSDGPRYRPAVPHDSGQCLKIRRVDQLSWVTCAQVEGPRGPPDVPGYSGQRSRARGQPVVPVESNPGKTYRVVDQGSGATRAPVRGPESGRPSVLGNWGLYPRPRGVDNSSKGLGSAFESLRGRPAVSRDSWLSPRARGVDQLSQVTPAQVLGPAVNHLSQAPRAHARCPVGSTSCPVGLRPGSECPRCRPSVPRFGPGSQVLWGQTCVPGNSYSGPRACGVDQLSRASRARV